MSTEVILRADIDGLGKRGDIIEVKDGYSRNSVSYTHLTLPTNREV